MNPLFWIFLVFGLILAASYAIAWWLSEHAPWRNEDEELHDRMQAQLRQLDNEIATHGKRSLAVSKAQARILGEFLDRGGKP